MLSRQELQAKYGLIRSTTMIEGYWQKAMRRMPARPEVRAERTPHEDGEGRTNRMMEGGQGRCPPLPLVGRTPAEAPMTPLASIGPLRGPHCGMAAQNDHYGHIGRTNGRTEGPPVEAACQGRPLSNQIA